jgi:hypothetical protein
MDEKRVARRKVAVLLKRFFEHLTGSFATGTTDLWHKVERRMAQGPPASAREPLDAPTVPPGALPTPMQQQPMQQQQAKTKGEEAK